MPYVNTTDGKPLTAESAKRWFRYDAATGRLYRKLTHGEKFVGTPRSDGHRVVGYNRRTYRTTHIIWLLVYGRLPVGVVDHIDGDPSNDRILNLRECTQSQNMANTATATSRSKSGVKGVFWDKDRGKWSVYVTKDYKTRFIGRYDSLDEAQQARIKASENLFGEFAR